MNQQTNKQPAIKFILPFGQGRYDLYKDGRCLFFTDDPDPEKDEEIERYSNIESFMEDLKAIVERQGWGTVSPRVKSFYESL